MGFFSAPNLYSEKTSNFVSYTSLNPKSFFFFALNSTGKSFVVMKNLQMEGNRSVKENEQKELAKKKGNKGECWKVEKG